jgi:hypothetical protein
MRVAVLGACAVGARAVRQLASSDAVSEIVVADANRSVADEVVASIAEPDRVRLGALASWADGIDVAVLATPNGEHRTHAERLLEQGSHVVSVSDDVDEVRGLLELDALARTNERSVLVAKVGTAGPACARAHHRALAGEALDWRDGAFVSRRAGSGRELCWFPDPVGGRDCYRAALPDAPLLVGAFPNAARITARVGATRRDRLTMGLPMLRKPHPEGTIGAIRVELRGWRNGSREVAIFGAMDRPGVAAGCVAAVASLWAGEGRVLRPGAGGLAELIDPVPFLAELARRGVKAAVFDGVPG